MLPEIFSEVILRIIFQAIFAMIFSQLVFGYFSKCLKSVLLKCLYVWFNCGVIHKVFKHFVLNLNLRKFLFIWQML